MDNLFDRLEHEHRAILDAVDAFSRFLLRAKRGDVDAHDLPRFVLFFREYVDMLHHEREDRILLPALARHDFSPLAGPLAYVREQHDHERQLLHELVSLCFRRGGCSPTDPELQRCANAFIAFQREHIEREGMKLYPVARSTLRNEHARLQTELARFDAEREAYGRIAWLERLLGELTAVYLPSAAELHACEPSSGALGGPR